MFLQIQDLNEEIVREANIFIDEETKKECKLKTTYNESIVARYLIAKNKNIFSSISHKEEVVFIWTDSKKLGVDLEIYKERDESILDSFSKLEYKKVLWKSWDSFYLLWTAKESIIKLLGLSLDDMNKITLQSFQKNDRIISEIKFSYDMIFYYSSIEIKVFSWTNKNYYFSIANLW